MHSSCRDIDPILGDLYEDVHWILLVVGNVLSLDVDGETALIPSEVLAVHLLNMTPDT